MASEVFSEKVTEVRDGVLSQPNALTCQSACVAMALGRNDVMAVRNELEAIGDPGDPSCMGVLLKRHLNDRYIFDDNASLNQVRDWLKAGEFLITHGWFTGSGHVIGLDGVAIDTDRMSYRISVKDPWSEFDFPAWAYNKSADRYDGYYSAFGIYAACVAGQSVAHARNIYRRGELNSALPGAWIHRIRP